MIDGESIPEAPGLEEQEAWDRLASINAEERADVIKELYTFGLRITTEAGEQIKGLEQKAITFAAYGTAVLSLLVTTASTWSKIGTPGSFVIAGFAGLGGLLCAWSAVRALLLVSFDTVSERDWLSKDHFGSLGEIERFHAYALTQVLKSRIQAQASKATYVESAQGWLAVCAGYLMLLLAQIASANLLPGWYDRTLHFLGRETWTGTSSARALSAACTFVFCCLLAALCRRRWGRA